MITEWESPIILPEMQFKSILKSLSGGCYQKELCFKIQHLSEGPSIGSIGPKTIFHHSGQLICVLVYSRTLVPDEISTDGPTFLF